MRHPGVCPLQECVMFVFWAGLSHPIMNRDHICGFMARSCPILDRTLRKWPKHGQSKQLGTSKVQTMASMLPFDTFVLVGQSGPQTE